MITKLILILMLFYSFV